MEPITCFASMNNLSCGLDVRIDVRTFL